ncbi:MAG: DedA family protein [Candidatus Kryptoniota bacterium]
MTPNGYLTIFVMVAFSGEIGLLTGVALAKVGLVTVPGVIAVGSIASFIGNMFYFYTGRILWNKWGFLQRRFGKKVGETMNVVQKYGSPLMLFARFFYGIRNVIPVALGVYQISFLPFVIYNVVGALIWSWFFTEAGFGMSILLGRLITDLNEAILWSVGTSLFMAVLYFVIRRLIKKGLVASLRKKRAAH